MADSLPSTISAIEVRGSGADRTSELLLAGFIKPLLNARNQGELGYAAQQVQRALYRTQCYENIALGVAKTNLGEDALVLDLSAVKKISIKTGTEVGNGEGSGYVKGSLKNILGLAEVLSFDVSTGTRTKSAHQASFSAPAARFLSPEWQFEALGYSSQRKVEWSSHQEQVRGVTFRLSNSNHTFGIDSVLRSIYITSKSAGLAVRQYAGHALKHSLHHNWEYDSRDFKLIPSSGMLCKTSTELAAGNNPFLKLSTEFQRGFKLNNYITGSFGLKMGGLQPLTSTSKPHIMDHFFLGGPLDLRGFQMSRVGPQDKSDFTGGTAMWTSGLSIYSKLPRVKTENLRAHAFLGAGSLGNHLNAAPKFYNQLQQIASSFGFGLVYSHSQIRFELNFVLPLTASPSDQTHKGLQFGVGLNFL